MEFVQIIEFTTSNYGEIAEFDRRWREATEGKRTLRRELVARDRNDPNHYFVLAFFDSYESAMENSKLPETQEISTRFAELADGPVAFRDLDIIEDV